jgi:hypothetical protein
MNILPPDAEPGLADTVADLHGMPALVCAPDGPRIGSEQDAMDLIAESFSADVDLVIVPAERFDDAFFVLSTGLAGAIVQKFVGYRRQLAIVGDISRHLAASSALRAFVAESNRGWQLCFAADDAELDARLARWAGRRRPA